MDDSGQAVLASCTVRTAITIAAALLIRSVYAQQAGVGRDPAALEIARKLPILVEVKKTASDSLSREGLPGCGFRFCVWAYSSCSGAFFPVHGRFLLNNPGKSP